MHASKPHGSAREEPPPPNPGAQPPAQPQSQPQPHRPPRGCPPPSPPGPPSGALGAAAAAALCRRAHDQRQRARALPGAHGRPCAPPGAAGRGGDAGDVHAGGWGSRFGGFAGSAFWDSLGEEGAQGSAGALYTSFLGVFGERRDGEEVLATCTQPRSAGALGIWLWTFGSVPEGPGDVVWGIAPPPGSLAGRKRRGGEESRAMRSRARTRGAVQGKGGAGRSNAEVTCRAGPYPMAGAVRPRHHHQAQARPKPPVFCFQWHCRCCHPRP